MICADCGMPQCEVTHVWPTMFNENYLYGFGANCGINYKSLRGQYETLKEKVMELETKYFKSGRIL